MSVFQSSHPPTNFSSASSPREHYRSSSGGPVWWIHEIDRFPGQGVPQHPSQEFHMHPARPPPTPAQVPTRMIYQVSVGYITGNVAANAW